MDDSSGMVDQALETAYRATNYIVFSPAFTIHIDAFHHALDAWLSQYEYTRWCFITAANPKSQLLAAAANLQRNEQLKERLNQLGYSYFHGQGCSIEGNWPCEPSFWVPGIPKAAAIALAIAFGQHAIVYGAFAQKAKLIWTTPSQISP
ncbi:MAG: DUF3293 domain-containing protein [Bacteroidota bacterium]